MNMFRDNLPGTTGRTITDLLLEKPGYDELIKEWPTGLTDQAFEFVWRGYDLLKDEVLDRVDCNKADKQIEKDTTSNLESRIGRVMTRDEAFDEAFDVQHEAPEFTTTYSNQAQPPSYDIAFILRANPQIKLPLEAKVLKTEGKLSEYIKEIKFNFLTCRYSPFSSEAGMLGYLLTGNPKRVFKNIEKKVPCTLSDHPDFLDRDHKVSDHDRTVPPNKPYPKKFRCHHLILNLQSTKKSNVSQETKSTKVSKPVSDSEE
ncbi:hypothetical protein [Lyngbya sp. CCY1209]|uniref:hypothetical protein n=1 Tax=Lyngbya sp. CCY1209 TaxID=2886103 RepID=UPI002D216DA8|nr:hypothetical protein [Lyngbya sp. CCY1209]MEB3883990.1 hypothetical protein [Lyngbya sp. CCY1209]